MDEKQDYLKQVYYTANNPSSFSGPRKLYWFVKKDGKYHFTLKEIREWLRSQPVYTTHIQPQRNFRRVKIIANRPGYLFEADLAHMNPDWKDVNDGNLAFVVVIDVFSR